MTQEEKLKIQMLRQQGYGYVKIAQELHLPKNTVKSFCYRNPVAHTETHHICKECGKPVTQNPDRREKKFCSIACRMRWWNHHAGELRHHKSMVCNHCGKSYYGKPGRKYCSHECYIAERFGDKNVATTV